MYHYLLIISVISQEQLRWKEDNRAYLQSTIICLHFEMNIFLMRKLHYNSKGVSNLIDQCHLLAISRTVQHLLMKSSHPAFPHILHHQAFPNHFLGVVSSHLALPEYKYCFKGNS